MKVLIYFHFLAVFCAAQCFAAPVSYSVSGTVAHGQSVTIYGSGFGVKSPAAPLLWDNFESGVSGSELSTDEKWPSYGAIGAEYSNNLSYSGGLSVRNHVYYGSGAGFRTNYHVVGRDATRLYASYMFYHNGTDYIDGVPKNWRIRAGSDPYHSEPGGVSLSDGYVFYNGGDGSMYPSDDNGGGRYFSDAVYGATAWTRYQVSAKHSTPNTSNGSYWVAVGNETKTFDAIQTRNEPTQYFNTFMLGLMHDEPSLPEGASHDMYIDDVYIDTTPARVELSPSPIWDESAANEIQIPSAWSDDAVTIAVNTQHVPGTTLYLYVIDPDGVAQASGLQVVVGGGYSGDPAPTPTTSGPLLRTGSGLLRVGDGVLRMQ